MSELMRPEEEGESNFEEYFGAFLNWAPDTDTRREYALRLADPEFRTGDESDQPTPHQGRNLLLANWNSPEHYLRNIYEKFYELSDKVAKTRRGTRVIVCELVPAADVESILSRPEYEAMRGKVRLQIGSLESKDLDFQYGSKLKRGGKGVRNVKPPYLLGTARLQLASVQDISFNIGEMEKGLERERDKVSAITLASTLSRNKARYREQNLAEVSPVIIGDDECIDFLAHTKEQYMVD